MYSCPACGAEDIAGHTTCRCGADLTLLVRLDAVADAWFNRALEELARGAEGRALEWLSACCAARPTDAAAHRALARVWARLGHYAEALDALERASELDPAAEGLAALREAIGEAAAPKPRATPKPRTKKAGKRKPARASADAAGE